MRRMRITYRDGSTEEIVGKEAEDLCAWGIKRGWRMDNGKEVISFMTY